MGTKNNPGNFDCYADADADEPMFVLLGRDKHAPTLVWLWATMREFDEEDPAKVAEARDCAFKMLEWARDHGRPVVGFGQATMAGLCELIRSVNAGVRLLGAESKTKPTDIELMRLFFGATAFEADIESKARAQRAPVQPLPESTGSAHEGVGNGPTDKRHGEGRGSEGLQPERPAGSGGHQGDHGVADLQDGGDSRPQQRAGGPRGGGGDHEHPDGQHVVRPGGDQGTVVGEPEVARVVPPATEDLFARALAKLSPEDQMRAYDDVIVFGTVFIEELPDGTAHLVSPEDMRIGHMGRDGIEYQRPPFAEKFRG